MTSYSITLTPAYPYYDTGVRSVNIDCQVVYIHIDLSFLVNYDINSFSCRLHNYINSLFGIHNSICNLIVVSNENNLSGLTINYYNFDIVGLFFNIDMSKNSLILKNTNFNYINLLTFVESGVNFKLDSYRLICDMHYFNIKNPDNVFFQTFNSCILKNKYLSSNPGSIDIEIIFTVEESYDELVEFMNKFISILKTSYKRKNKKVNLILKINVISEYAYNEVKEYSGILEQSVKSTISPLFDNVKLDFYFRLLLWKTSGVKI